MIHKIKIRPLEERSDNRHKLLISEEGGMPLVESFLYHQFRNTSFSNPSSSNLYYEEFWKYCYEQGCCEVTG